MKSRTFTNEYGEKFVVYTDGITAYMSGDETDGKTIPLFNPDFDIWNKEELYKLGKALMEMNK